MLERQKVARKTGCGRNFIMTERLKLEREREWDETVTRLIDRRLKERQENDDMLTSLRGRR